MSRTVIRTSQFETGVDLNRQVVSLLFRDKDGNEADVWLAKGDVFVVINGLRKLIDRNPQMQTWVRDSTDPIVGPSG
jgi:hypothetical protein